MKKIKDDIERVIADLGGDPQTIRVNRRIHEVQERYKAAIMSVYPESTALLHLAHTNNVIITTKKGVRTLLVYVDDSLFAAELNAQRELIRLRLLELFGENVEVFQINTSRWQKYRNNHPYLSENNRVNEEKQPDASLNCEEKSFISSVVSAIEDEQIRESLRKAITADLKWKKGEKVESKQKNTK